MDDDDSDIPGEFVVVTDPGHQNTSKSLPTYCPTILKQMETLDSQIVAGPQFRNERQLLFEEKKFLLAVERGDLATVRRTMEKAIETNHINVNCVDPLGRSALLMAIDNENLEMVELLIEYKVETKDALLHAIHEQYVEAVEVLLEHESMIHKPGTPHSWEALDPDAATFTPDITPLILAAHRDNYEIIKILFDRGATLPMPHDVRCGCSECVTSRLEDSLRHSRSRINAYRALASPSLIALSSKDPILTAFELSWELRRLSLLEHEFKAEYQELRKRCQNFATSLLDHTRSSYELEVMLNHDPTGPAFEHGERMHLNRLKLAIKYKHKKFVAHPNVQQLLASIWYDGLPGFRRKNIVFQTLQIVWIGFLFPVYSFVYILFPHTVIGQTMRKPFIKFICHSASYVTFLFLLILASQRIETVITDWFASEEPHSLHATPEHVKSKRGAPPSLVEWTIMAWVMGLIWMEIKQLWEDGLYEYIGDMWNIIDFITNSLYVATILLRAVAYYQVQNELASKSSTAELRREHWDDWDPMLLSEGLFSAANIFSSLKLVHIFSVNPHLGPLQISLGRMVIDIIKFFFVFCLVLFAFACGMNQLLWYYADTERQECKIAQSDAKSGADACYRWRRFANLFESTQTLFWAVFGLIDLNNFELNGIKSYTRFWGMLMFGCYSVINVVVLLNLLIAMMNHSYQLISDRTDVEWKFARSKLWISYFEEGGTVPPPFNIIPTPKIIYYLFRWFFRKTYGRSKAAKKEHMRTIRKKARQASERDFRYQNIMKNLVRRYVTVQQRKADNQGVTEDDVNEIKQDISSFRYELIEILKNSGMNTSTAHEQPQGPGGKKGRLKERRLMKGFNIGRTESFPLGGGDTSMDKEVTPKTPGSASVGGSLRSPRGKLKRAANKAGTAKQSSRKRWGHLVDAAKSVKNTFGRSLSQDSFGSQTSIGQKSPAGTGGAPSSHDESILSISGTIDSSTTCTFGESVEKTEEDDKTPTSMEVHQKRLMKLRSRLACLSQIPSRFRLPSFDESKSNAKARRHLYGGKIHTGSLKMFARRKSGDLMFSSQRIVTSKTALSSATHLKDNVQNNPTTSSESGLKHTLPPEAPLTPIPSQPSSSNRSSPEVLSPPPSPKAISADSGSSDVGATSIAIPPRTSSPSMYSVPAISSPESGVMSESCSQEPLVVSRRNSSPKPSNGSALISKLPGIQPIGKNAPSGWL